MRTETSGSQKPLSYLRRWRTPEMSGARRITTGE
jgi:hypothetical protein